MEFSLLQCTGKVSGLWDFVADTNHVSWQRDFMICVCDFFRGEVLVKVAKST